MKDSVPISLSSGASASLTKCDTNLSKIIIGIGYDCGRNWDIELDAVVFLLTFNDKVRNSSDFIFYNQLESADGSCKISDDLTTAAPVDDEEIFIDFSKVSSEVQTIVICLTIYDDKLHNSNFGMFDSIYLRVVSLDNWSEVIRFQLDKEFSDETALVLGEFHRKSDEWRFKAIGIGHQGGLKELAKFYGVTI